MRYTEIKLSKISNEFLFKKIKNIVNMKNNFDNSLKEPKYIPTNFPNLLINGSYGIAVGMSTNMMPHNLCEIIDSICKFIKHPNINIKKIIKIIKGPDFPTGGIILNNNKYLNYLYKGKGKITLISKYKINYKKNIIIINEIPYQISKLKIIEQLYNAIKNKKINNIIKIIDKSDRKGIKIFIYFKKKCNIKITIKEIFKYSQLKINININNLVLVKKKPKILNIKELIYYYIKYRHKILYKELCLKFKKNKNILLKINNILKIIKNLKLIVYILKKSNSKKYLIKKFKKKYFFNKQQIKEILKIKLFKLSKYEFKKNIIKKKKIINKINKLKKILKNKKIRMKIIYNKLKKIKNKYGDNRLTSISKNNNIKKNYIKKIKKIIILYYNNFYIKKIYFNSYKKIKTKKIINNLIITYNNMYLLCITLLGYCLLLKIKNIIFNKINNINNYIKIKKNDKIISFIKIKKKNKKYKYIFIITNNNFIKKIKINKCINFKKNIIKIITLKKNDFLYKCFLIKTKIKKNFALLNNGIIIKDIINIKSTKCKSKGIKKYNIKKNIKIINIIYKKKYILIYNKKYIKININNNNNIKNNINFLLKKQYKNIICFNKKKYIFIITKLGVKKKKINIPFYNNKKYKLKKNDKISFISLC